MNYSVDVYAYNFVPISEFGKEDTLRVWIVKIRHSKNFEK